MGLKPLREARPEVIPVEGRVEGTGEKLESGSLMLNSILNILSVEMSS